MHSRQGRGLQSCNTGYRRLICGLLGAAALVDKWALDGWWVGPGRDSYQWWGGRGGGGGALKAQGAASTRIRGSKGVRVCVCGGGGGVQHVQCREHVDR